MKTIVNSLTVNVLTAVALIGCGLEHGELTPQEADAVGQGLTEAMDDAAAGFDFSEDAGNDGAAVGLGNLPVRRIVRRVRARRLAILSQLCMSGAGEIQGSPSVDVDADGIADDVAVVLDQCTFENASEQGELESIVLDGALSLKDTDTSGATFGYEIESTQLSLSATAKNGNTLYILLDGTEVGSEDAAAGSYSIDIDGNRMIEASVSGDNHALVQSLDWVATYTPGSAWEPGQRPVAGQVAISGDYGVTYDGKDFEATLETLPTVGVDPTCHTERHIVSGSAKATRQGPNSSEELTATWSGCGVVDVEYSATRTP